MLGRYGEERSCCSHVIDVDTLEAVILETIQYTVKDVRLNPDAFAEKMKDASELRSKNETRKLKQKMNRQEKRIKELDALVRRIYEDDIAGKLSDKRYEAMYEDYDREQTELEKLLEEEKERIAAFEVTADRFPTKQELLEKYGDLLVSNEGVEEFLRKSGEAESPISALSGGGFNGKINRKKRMAREDAIDD